MRRSRAEQTMGIEVAHSTRGSVAEVVRELKDGLSAAEPVLVLFFASPVFDPVALARQMQEAFPGAQTVGCTTAGEITSARMLKRSAVAMAFGPDVVTTVGVQLLEGLEGGIDRLPDLRSAFGGR